jgi:putative peptide zinc metalloprotease protein
VLYDVSFALVWADQGAALNRNEAYALASCRDCTTVAVAFQVVLLVGSVDVVVPENIAAAVNYACVECVTHALATQLVVSLPGPLSDDGTRELAAIWAELQEFGRRVEGLPLAELRTRLTEFEQRILAVVRGDTAVQDSDQAGTPAPTGSTDPGATEPGATAGPTRTGGASPTATGTASTTTPPAATADPSSGTDAGPTGSTTGESEPIATTSPASGSAASTGSPGTTG